MSYPPPPPGILPVGLCPPLLLGPPPPPRGALPMVTPSPPRPSPKTKDGLIRMLLQSATPTPPLPTSPLPAASIAAATPPCKPCPPRFPLVGGGSPGNTPIRIMPPSSHLRPGPLVEVTDEDKSSSYIHQISGLEREIGLVLLDHPYAKPWNWKPDSAGHLRPTKTLFVPRVLRNQLPVVPSVTSGFIDVVEDEPTKSRPLDVEKAELVMNECLRHVNFANPNVKKLSESDDWEENLSKEGWTLPLHRLFNKTMKILHADRLSRLAQKSVANEPILRRLALDKTAKRVRQVLAGVLWDAKMIQWLHNTLCEHLPREYLAIYFDVLQTLRAAIPSLIDKMTAGRVSHQNLAKVTKEGLRILLKKKWDPAATSLNEQKIKKLPGNPILIFTPSEPTDMWHAGTSRSRHWNAMLSQLGKLVFASMPHVDKDGSTEIGYFLQHTVTNVIAKIREVKRGHHDRPVILVSWGVGAAINCQVANMESVQGIVCLGFPLFTLDGIRGEADDPLLELKCPVLFVVGQNACQTRSDDIEDMREKMRGETGLVIVGGADDLLRVSKHKKKAEGVTQSMVDRCIMDDVREFLMTILTSPPPTFAMPTFSSSETPPTSRKTPVARRRKPATNSDGSPVVKRARTQSRSNTPAKGPRGSAPSSAAPSPLAASTPVSLAGNLMPLPPASLTPTSSLPNPGGADGLQKARKVLDMNQRGKADAANNIMASSPLLSSALTSPTKTTTSTTPRLVSTTSMSTPLPTTPIVLPTKPTAPPLRQPTVIHPPMPNLASMLHPLSSPTVVMPTPKPRPQFIPPAASTIIRMVSTSAPKQVTMSDLSKNTISTSMVVLTSQGAKATTASMSKALVQTVSASGTRFTVPQNIPAVSVKKSTAAGQGTKDLYIVSLPPDQLKSLEGSNIVQYSGSHLLTLVNDKLKGEGSTSGTPEGTIGSTERRNVAEILASLSGLVPEPPKSEMTETSSTGEPPKAVLITAHKSLAPPPPPSSTTVVTTASGAKVVVSRPSASILSTHSGPNRIVRVLQAGATRMPMIQQHTTVVKSTAVSAAAGNMSSMRSRKQIFVTAADREKEGGATAGQTKDNGERSGNRPTTSGRVVDNDDQDILEEDCGDLEYTPCPRKKASPKQQKAKCKTVKK